MTGPSGLRKEEKIMTARKLDIKGYCDSLYTEMFDTKKRLGNYVTMIEQTEGKDKLILNQYSRHLDELISFIDWKLEIFNKVCPVDWGKFTEGIESTVSVPPVGTQEKDQPAGGYMGG